MQRTRSSDPAVGGDSTETAFADLEKYAGWLARGAVQTQVRDDVKALGAALEDGNEIAECLRTLAMSVDKLGTGGIQGLLKKTLRKLCLELGHPVYTKERESPWQ